VDHGSDSGFHGTAAHPFGVLHQPHHTMAFYATGIGFNQMVRNCLAHLIIATEAIKDIDDRASCLASRDLHTTASQFQLRREIH